MIEKIFATYPSNPSNYSLQDFVKALDPSNRWLALTLAVVIVTFIIGFLEYIWSFLLVRREGHSPYPVLMHTYYFALDAMGIFVFGTAAAATGGFWFFVGGSIAECVWVGFEAYCLYKTIYTERQSIWGDDPAVGGGQVPVSYAWKKVLEQVVFFIAAINLFRVFMNDPGMFKWYIFTNVIMATVPGIYWAKRGTRTGASWVLAWIILVGTVNSFLPTNMWNLISPYFSPANNPWFYVMGVVSIGFAIHNLVVLHRLPAKPARMPDGQKSVL